MIEQFKSELIAIALYVTDPNKRLFIGYILGALLFAYVIYVTQKAKTTVGFWRFVLNPRVWLHKSAVLDYQLFVVNRIVRALLWAPVIVTMVPIALFTTDLLEWCFGKLQPVTDNAIMISLTFTFILFVLDDFTRFLLHYFMHKIPVLWEFHKVHHSAEVLTPFTVYRSHPLESFLYATRMALAQGAAVGLSYYMFGPTLSMTDILGANVFIFAFNVMGSNLRHSHIKWQWGERIEKWLISPLQHQIHHSRQVRFHDKNFGTALAVWDRLFGTLVISGKTKFLVFGIDTEASHTSILDAYVRPFKGCKRWLVKRKGGENRLLVKQK